MIRTIIQLLGETVSGAFSACGYPAEYGVVTPSDRLDLCQFQCNGAFACAKQAKKAPMVIAGEVAGKLRESPLFEKVEPAAPGFLNLTLCDSALMEAARGVGEDPHLGIPQMPQAGPVVIDYGGPNVAKPLHVGHLRSAIIGESLKRLSKACGYEVIGDIHLGDWGLQIGLVIAELERRNPGWKCYDTGFNPDTDTVPELDPDLLSEVYPAASKLSKEDEGFRKKAQKATYELQNGRAGYLALWKEILRVSVGDLKGNYQKLNVEFDLWYGESDADRYVPGLLRTLEEKGLLRESDGAMVVDIAQEDDKSPMPPVLIKKSDDSILYPTTDLATLVQREGDFHPAQIWYVVDKRQGLHFTQVFRCARKAGIVRPETDLEFLGFGTMNGSDGKPYKTRDGGVMRLADLLDTVVSGAMEKLDASAYLKTVSQEEKEAVALKVGVAAIKFGDLINHRMKDYIFDLEKFLSFEGKTGTYILYTVTRILSILKKAGAEENIARLKHVYSDVERELILRIILSGEVFQRALKERAPSYLCENAFQIASLFSRFYHDCNIINEPDEEKQKSWLALIGLTKDVLLKHLDVLGIEPVENM